MIPGLTMSARHNIGDLNAVLPLYQRLSGKDNREVLAKQGGELAYQVQKALRDIRPAKGAIRAQLLARLAAGRGFRVRQSVRDELAGKKTKSGQAELYRREIAVRESGLGFLAISARYPRALGPDLQAVSRTGPSLSHSVFVLSASRGEAGVGWTGLSKPAQAAAEAFTRPRPLAALAAGAEATKKNLFAYVGPRLKKRAESAAAAMLSGGAN